MANIINIDTSSSICSVSLAKDGETILGLESQEKMDHSKTLAPFVEKCLDFLTERGEKLDSVAVVSGPGSYTGLRIGLSLAKGLCFARNIPLITVSALQVTTVRALFSYPELEGDELIVPMIDAGRMEVYTSAYNNALGLELEEQPVILTENFLEDYKSRHILFIGNGTTKFRNLSDSPHWKWLGEGISHAKYMPALSEKYFREKRFADLAYTVPNYLKEYQTSIPKNKILNG